MILENVYAGKSKIILPSIILVEFASYLATKTNDLGAIDEAIGFIQTLVRENAVDVFETTP